MAHAIFSLQVTDKVMSFEVHPTPGFLHATADELAVLLHGHRQPLEAAPGSGLSSVDGTGPTWQPLGLHASETVAGPGSGRAREIRLATGATDGA